MVVLVNRKRHIFALGDTEVYCGMGSDTVSYEPANLTGGRREAPEAS